MFVVLNKEKIYAYVVSILTVVVLFSASTYITSDMRELEETSTSVENVNNMNQTNTTNVVNINEVNNTSNINNVILTKNAVN